MLTGQKKINHHSIIRHIFKPVFVYHPVFVILLTVLWAAVETPAASFDIKKTAAAFQPEYLEIEENDSGVIEVSSGLYYTSYSNPVEISRVADSFKKGLMAITDEQGASFGFSDKTYYICLPVNNKTAHALDFVVESGYPLIDYLNLYTRQGDGFQRFESGDLLPFHTRQYDYHNFAFKTELKPGINELYFEMRSESSLQLPLKLWQGPAFVGHVNNSLLGFGFYYGIMMIVLLLNIFMAVFFKSRTYIFYVIYLAIYILFQMGINGLSFQYLWPGAPGWGNISLPVWMITGFFWAAMFSRAFLNLKSLYPRFDLSLRIVMAVHQAGLLLLVFSGYSASIKFAVAFAGIIAVYLLLSGILAMVKKNRQSYFYMVAWVTLLLGVVVYVLKTAAVLPAVFITEYAIQIGSGLEVTILSLGLFDRIYQMQKEHEAVRQEAIQNRLSMLDSFSRFVPHQFIKLLHKESIADVAIGDAIQKKATIMFSDIRQFTRLSEAMGVEDNFRFLNAYLKRMAPLIHRNRGFIDKFIGDAILAIFPEKPDQAVEAAITMQKELLTYNSHRSKSGYEPLRIGTGLNTGDLMLGTVGSSSRLDTTVIGDTVNLAARVESLTRVYRVPVLVCGEVLKYMKEPDRFNLREIDSVRVKGKKRPVKIYEAFDWQSESEIEQKLSIIDDYNEMMNLYRTGRFKDARGLAAELLNRCKEDEILRIYLKRLDFLIENPPGEKWAGVSRVR